MDLNDLLKSGALIQAIGSDEEDLGLVTSDDLRKELAGSVAKANKAEENTKHDIDIDVIVNSANDIEAFAATEATDKDSDKINKENDASISNDDNIDNLEENDLNDSIAADSFDESLFNETTPLAEIEDVSNSANDIEASAATEATDKDSDKINKENDASISNDDNIDNLEKNKNTKAEAEAPNQKKPNDSIKENNIKFINEMLKRIVGNRQEKNEQEITFDTLISKTIDEKEKILLDTLHKSFLHNITNDKGVLLDNLQKHKEYIDIELYNTIKNYLNDGKTPQEIWYELSPAEAEKPAPLSENASDLEKKIYKAQKEIYDNFLKEKSKYDNLLLVFNSPDNSPFILLRDKLESIEMSREFIYNNRASGLDEETLLNLKRLNDEGKYTELSNLVRQEKEKIKQVESQNGELELKIAQKKMKELFAYRSNLATSTIELKSCLGSKMAILQQNQSKTGNKVSAYEVGQVKECFEKDYEKAKTNLEKAKEAPKAMLRDNMLLTPFALLIILAYAFSEAANNRIVEHYRRLKWWETNLYERFAKATPEERAEILKNLERAIKGASDDTFLNPKNLEKEDIKEKESVLDIVVKTKTNGKYNNIKTAMEEDYLNQKATESEILKAESNNPINKMMDGSLFQDNEGDKIVLNVNKDARKEIFDNFKFIDLGYADIQKYQDELDKINDKKIQSELEAFMLKLKDNAETTELKDIKNKIIAKEQELDKKSSEKSTDIEQQKREISELNQELQSLKENEKELKDRLKNVKVHTLFELEKEIKNIKDKIGDNTKINFIDDIVDKINNKKPKNGNRIALETADILYNTLQGQFLLYKSKNQLNHNLSVLKELSTENIRSIEINNYIKSDGSVDKILSNLSKEIDKIEDLENRALAKQHISSLLEQYRNGLLGKKPNVSYEDFVMAVNSFNDPAWKKNLEPTDDMLGENGRLRNIKNYAEAIQERNEKIDRYLAKLSDLSIKIDEAAYEHSENADEYKDLVEEYKKTRAEILSTEHQKYQQGNDPLINELSKTYDYRIKQIYGIIREFDYNEESSKKIHTLLNGFAKAFNELADSYKNDNKKTQKEKDAELKKIFYELKSSLKLNATTYPQYQYIYDEIKDYSFKKSKNSLEEIAKKLNDLDNSIEIEKAKSLKIDELRQSLAEANKKEHNKQVVDTIGYYIVSLNELKGKESDKDYRKKCEDIYNKCEESLKKLKEEKNENAVLVLNALNFLRTKVNIANDHIMPVIKDLYAEYNTQLVLRNLDLKELDTDDKAKKIIKEELDEFHKKIMGQKPEMNFKDLKDNIKNKLENEERIKDKEEIIQKLFTRMDDLRLTDRNENYICKDYKSLANAKKSVEAVDFFNKEIKTGKSLWGNIYKAINNGHSDKLSLISEVMPLDFTRLTIGGEVAKKLFDNFTSPSLSHDSLIDKNNITRILPATLSWLNTHFTNNSGMPYQEKIDTTMAIMESAENLAARQASIDGKNHLIKGYSVDANGKNIHCDSKYKYDALISNTELPEKRSVNFAARKNEHGQLLYGIYAQQTPGVHTTNDAMRFHNIFNNAGGKMQDMEKFARTKGNANFLNMINPIGISKGLSDFQHKEVLSIYNHTKTADEILADFAHNVISHHQASNQLKELSMSDYYGVKSAEKFMPATLQTCKNLFNKFTLGALQELDKIAEEKGLEILESTGVKLADEDARKEKETIKKKKKQDEELMDYYQKQQSTSVSINPRP